MAREWKRVRVDEIAQRTATGPFGSAISSKHFCDSGVPVIRGSNLSQETGIRLVDEGLTFVSEEKAREFARSEARPGDLVFTCWGTIDQVGLIDHRARYKRYIVSNKQMLFTPDASRADRLFLYYTFRSPENRSAILNQGIGSSVPGFNLGQLRSFEIDLPPLANQKAIAAVLGALDDKIELNRRMNATLEAMARALFQSWFVDFDPVRAKLDGRKPDGLDKATAALFPAAFQDSPLGPIPQGWRTGCLADIGTNSRRGVQPGEIAPNTPYIALEHMPRRCIALGDWDDSADVASGKSAFTKGEILFGKLRPYFHKVGVAPIDGVCSTDILVLAPKDPEWFGLLLGHASSDELIQFTDLASTGTKMPRTNWGDIGSFKVALPPKSVAGTFTRIIEPMLERINGNLYQSRTLATLRDTLLPKLLSGELSVL